MGRYNQLTLFWLLCLQYRAPFMPPTQQYSVASGTASFYPGTSPAEYPPYGEQPPTLPSEQGRSHGAVFAQV